MRTDLVQAIVAFAAVVTAAKSFAKPASADHGDLAKALANPLANLVSVPLQLNVNLGAKPRPGACASSSRSCFRSSHPSRHRKPLAVPLAPRRRARRAFGGPPSC
jgi:hypothetical protein